MGVNIHFIAQQRTSAGWVTVLNTSRLPSHSGAGRTEPALYLFPDGTEYWRDRYFWAHLGGYDPAPDVLFDDRGIPPDAELDHIYDEQEHGTTWASFGELAAAPWREEFIERIELVRWARSAPVAELVARDGPDAWRLLWSYDS